MLGTANLEKLLELLLASQDALGTQATLIQNALDNSRGLLVKTLNALRDDIAQQQATQQSIVDATAALQSGIRVLQDDRQTLQQEGVKLDSLGKQLLGLEGLLKSLQTPIPTQPVGGFSIKFNQKVKVGDETMLSFSVLNIPATDLTDPNNANVSQRVLTVSVAGAPAQTATIAGTAAVAEVLKDDAGNLFTGNNGDSVVASLVQMDSATPPNVSVPRTETATLALILTPDQPGDFGVGNVKSV